MSSGRRSLRIVLTGGGTAGHVMPHIALLPMMRDNGWEVSYIGSSGIEEQLSSRAKIDYYRIPTGKLRRYWSWQNFTDLFRIVAGIFKSWWLLGGIKPDVVFSKGGFVSVPVAFAAWVRQIPVVTHESDLTPGLATRLLAPVCRSILCAFEQTVRYLPAGRSKCVGLPVRQSLLAGNRQLALELCGFRAEDPRPVVMIAGGSQGAVTINRWIADQAKTTCQHYRIVHLTGHADSMSIDVEGYRAFSFVHEELADLVAIADMVVSRAGANSIFEWLAARIPMLLIPLVRGSRGDQIDNAKAFRDSGLAHVLDESQLSSHSLKAVLDALYAESSKITQRMTAVQIDAPHRIIIDELCRVVEMNE